MPGLGSQELYRMVLDSLPVAVCAVDREGKVILWNDGAERVTGYLRQDVLGHLCTDAFLEHADTDNNPMEGRTSSAVRDDAGREMFDGARIAAEEVRAIRGRACADGSAARG